MKNVFEKLSNTIQTELKGFASTISSMETTNLDKSLLTKLPAILTRRISTGVEDNEHLRVQYSILVISKAIKEKHKARFKDHSPFLEAIMYQLNNKWLVESENKEDVGFIKFKNSKNLYSPETPSLLKDEIIFEITQVPNPTSYDLSELKDFNEIQQQINVENYEQNREEKLND